jgi:hypothetical protein
MTGKEAFREGKGNRPNMTESPTVEEEVSIAFRNYDSLHRLAEETGTDIETAINAVVEEFADSEVARKATEAY